VPAPELGEQATIAVSQVWAGVHTSWQHVVALLLQVGVAGAVQSVATWHWGWVGHGVVVNAHVPLLHHDFGHEVPPPGQAVHGLVLVGQSVSCTHCGVGQVGYTTSQTPFTQLLVAHIELPSTHCTHVFGAAGQFAVLVALGSAATVHAVGLHMGATTPHTPFVQLAA
jgi:hypothetical protein